MMTDCFETVLHPPFQTTNVQQPPIVVTFGSGNKLNKITMADEDNKRKKSECWSLTGEVYLLYSQCVTAEHL